MNRNLVLAMLLAGCAPSMTAPAAGPDSPGNATPEHMTALNESPRPMKPRAPATVAIYRTKVPDAPYVEVSELVDVGDDEMEALDKLKLSAAGVGCDGLIIGETHPRSVSSRFGAGSHVTAVDFSGTCIMFTQDPGTWRPSEIDVRCAADRERLAAAKTDDERLAIARAMPRACHAGTAD